MHASRIKIKIEEEDMLRNKSRSVLSRLFLLCRNRPPRPLREHAAASQLRVPEAARRRLPFSFSESGGHIIKRPPPPLVSSRRRPEIPWHHDPRKVAAATAIAAGASAIAAHLRYGETVPFTGRTHLVVLSHQEARELEEADFADLVKKHDILGPHHPHTVRIRHIAREIITAAHIALDIKQRQTGGRGVNLDWMEKLDWEVIVVESDNFLVGTYPGAAKIIVSTRVLERHCKSDAEIAAFLSHEVAHVIARHTSEMISNWFPIKFLLRRQEIEADHIGMLLFAAAGFDPRIVPLVWDRFAKKEAYSTMQIWERYITDAHPCSNRRSQLLSWPEKMKEALELYRQVRPRVQPKYPETQEHEKRDDRLLPRLVHFFRNRMQAYDGISQVSR